MEKEPDGNISRSLLSVQIRVDPWFVVFFLFPSHALSCISWADSIPSVTMRAAFSQV